MRRDTARFISGAALVASLAVILLMAGKVLSDKGIDWFERLANIAAAAIPIGALIVTFARRVLPWPGPKVVEADESFLLTVRDDLAATLMRQIIEDERLRRVSDPWPLPVRWVLHSRGSTTEGVFENLAGAYAALASRRMVILGAAGAGKSVLLSRLAKDLLVMRKAGQSVPFVLPAPTWMPGDSLLRWLARELARRHPGLGTAVKTQVSLRGAVTLAETLAADGVVPFIDGLDELAEPMRAQLIREINAYGSDRPLVVTSRPEEFHDATLAGGRRVSRTAVGELLPLAPAAAMEYLAAATSAWPAGRWTEVFDRLRDEPDGVLAQVLTNPLMLWLTRTIYEDSTAEPAELATSAYSTDRTGVEQHLLEHLVPAVYRRQDTRWDVRKAQRWLGFLATWMTTSHTQDIAWWRLITTVPVSRMLGAIVRVLALSTVLCGLLVWAGLSLVLLPNLAMQGPLGQGGVGILANLILSLLVPFRPVVGPLIPAVAGNTYLTLFVWVTGISLLVALTGSLKSTEHQQPKTLRVAPNQLLLPVLKQVVFCTVPLATCVIAGPK